MNNRVPPSHHNHFTALFPGAPGWASARRGLLDFMAQGKINRGRHTNYLASTIPPFFTGRMPFLLPNQQCQSTEGK